MDHLQQMQQNFPQNHPTVSSNMISCQMDHDHQSSYHNHHQQLFQVDHTINHTTSHHVTHNPQHHSQHEEYHHHHPSSSESIEIPSHILSMGSTHPIDMDQQAKMKLERKRLRNRIAASKCRKRKLEKISRLEDRVKLIRGENSGLTHSVQTLRDQVMRLKQDVIDHSKYGCILQNDNPKIM